MNLKSLFTNMLVSLLLLGSFETFAADSAGNVIRASGVVNAVDASGKSRPLAAGDAINVGDVVESSEKSAVQIQMKDAAIIAMAADSALKIDSYRFQTKAAPGDVKVILGEDAAAKSSEPDKVDLSVQKGRVRTITGRAGKAGYAMEAMGVIVKIKGTIYDVLYMPDGSMIIILREGSVSVTSGGVTVVLDVPGTMTKIPAKGKAPGKPIPATASTDDLDVILPLTKTGDTIILDPVLPDPQVTD